jgi:serine protease AprX
MPIKIPRSLVEFILLGPEDDRRQLQDSPILGDVWIEYAQNPARRLEVLITPYRENAAAQVARTLRDWLQEDTPPEEDQSAIAYLQGIVAAQLTFGEVMRVVVPMTSWWADARIQRELGTYSADGSTMEKELEATRQEALNWLDDMTDIAIQDLPTRKRYAALAGLLLWAAGKDVGATPAPAAGSIKEQNRQFLKQVDVREVARELTSAFERMHATSADPLVWTISLNRRVHPALTKSVPAVKADAARTLFTVSCKEIVWAVIDSGVDARHLAFLDRKGESRVLNTFDFTRMRDVVTLDNLVASRRRAERVDRIRLPRPHRGTGRFTALKNPLEAHEVVDHLEALAHGAEGGLPIDWQRVEKLIELDSDSPPATNHGTHVAGILGASRDAALVAIARARDPAARWDKAQADAAPAAATPLAAASSAPVTSSEPSAEEKNRAKLDPSPWSDGMCPDIGLYDLRVLAPTLKETEFAVIAALQYIRHINERNSWMTIHGANLSLSIPHDVRNYACGRTPVCNECERLVNSGVVVVAAAGNRGYQNFETTEGLYENYAAFSVTDPGNADGVITVGATHRYWPHTYGVSFFSSRGPTGDGRLKPDLVAPGERIRAPIPDNEWGDLDGTSMASPHVSGAAAMLMARYSEMVGQPRRIKDVLCQSSTDLGREKSFQGHGMLDVLRAFQSV